MIKLDLYQIGLEVEQGLDLSGLGWVPVAGPMNTVMNHQIP
jgi:hypothetical protein